MTRRILVCGLALFVLAGANLMGNAQGIAKVAYVEGRVEILSHGSSAPMRAEIGMTLFPGDSIRTYNGKCQISLTSSILRLPPGATALFPAHYPPEGSMLVKLMVGKTVKNFRQLVGLDPDEVFEVRGDRASDYSAPAPPEVVALRAKEDAERLAAERNRARAPQSSGTGEEQAVAEYRSLLPAVLQAEKKPWHTRFEFLANAVKTGTGYRVAYKTYCLIDKGPDAGKDYACYELDTVLDIGAVKTAVADMKRRLGR